MERLGLRSAASSGALPPEPLFWIERVVGHIPYDVRHQVTIERLQPQPARIVGWGVGAVQATTRLTADREAVEVTFAGSVHVNFVDHEGEMCEVRRAFTARREFIPVEDIPIHGGVRALARGAPGEGALVPVGRPAGFRGTVHLHAFITLTEPALWRHIPGEPVSFTAYSPARPTGQPPEEEPAEAADAGGDEKGGSGPEDVGAAGGDAVAEGEAAAQDGEADRTADSRESAEEAASPSEGPAREEAPEGDGPTPVTPPGQSLVWRLPQTDPVSTSPPGKRTSRPGARDGSR